MHRIIIGLSLFSLGACMPGAGIKYPEQGNVSKDEYVHVSGVSKRKNASKEVLVGTAGAVGHAAGHIAAGGAASNFNTQMAIQEKDSDNKAANEKESSKNIESSK